ncbi:tetraspanin-8-like [Rhodamnia argentea]|uniref:Tetraspanin-8-like n=1 Tax=Rhodamnia argentea TaxID=178133 RepID=A0A8B8NHB0_9MYRT|nr:tetraspanin-8-like [Rhodamnia argentea]
MARISNTIVTILNVLSAVLALVAVGTSARLMVHSSTECQKSLQGPLLISGVVLLVISLIGLIGSCGRNNFFLYTYLTLLFLSILALIAFTVFAFLVTNESAGKAVSGQGFKEYRLGDYSHWMQDHLVNGEKWNEIRSCLVDSNLCGRLGEDVHQTEADFYKQKLSAIQSGCCKPPSYCGFEFKNATYWTVPKSGPAAPDTDCLAWSNHQETLCYDCKSCKGGFLANGKKEWRNLLICNVLLVVIYMVVYSIGCCASRNNREDRKYAKYKGYP